MAKLIIVMFFYFEATYWMPAKQLFTLEYGREILQCEN
jgi:hypothetical protein